MVVVRFGFCVDATEGDCHRGENAQPLLDVIFGEYCPNQVVSWKRAGSESAIPLLEGCEALDGKATAYVCQNFACQMPVMDAEALKAQMKD